MHSNIPNSVLEDMLKFFKIRPASRVHNLHLRLKRDKYQHISSFCRAVYIHDDENLILPSSILLKYNNENHRIFVTNDELHCYLCKSTGHTASSCAYEGDDEVVEEEIQNNVTNVSPPASTSTKDTPQIIPDAPLNVNTDSSIIKNNIPEIITIDSDDPKNLPPKPSNTAPKHALSDTTDSTHSATVQHTSEEILEDAKKPKKGK